MRVGLPMVYDKDLIEKFWSKERGALNQRWGYFVQKAVPFLTKMMTLIIRDGKISDDEIPGLSRKARLDLQDLGGLFVGAGFCCCGWCDFLIVFCFIS